MRRRALAVSRVRPCRPAGGRRRTREGDPRGRRWRRQKRWLLRYDSNDDDHGDCEEGDDDADDGDETANATTSDYDRVGGVADGDGNTDGNDAGGYDELVRLTANSCASKDKH